MMNRIRHNSPSPIQCLRAFHILFFAYLLYRCYCYNHYKTQKYYFCYRYLKRTEDIFLVYRGDKVLVVNGYVDASFDTDPDDSKSQTGYVFILNGGAVSWCSSKQSVVADSTCEAEYMAASEAAKEGVWMKEFMTDLGVVPSARDPMTLFCDNTGAIALAKEPRFHKRTRHIKRRFNSIRHSVELEEINICKVHTDLNVADPLTKPLPRAKHDPHQNYMGVRYLIM